ncbi:MAG: hypothetical protein ACRBN8_01190 [Nannocystales bacterium]
MSTEVELLVEEVECDLGEAVGACYAGRPLGVTFQLLSKSPTKSTAVGSKTSRW